MNLVKHGEREMNLKLEKITENTPLHHYKLHEIKILEETLHNLVGHKIKLQNQVGIVGQRLGRLSPEYEEARKNFAPVKAQYDYIHERMNQLKYDVGELEKVQGLLVK